MKDSFFEMLLHLFEKTLTQLKEKQGTPEQQDVTLDSSSEQKIDVPIDHIKMAQHTSIRVFTREEQMKLTKTSYQFLMRLMSWEILDSQTLELILNRLIFSESRYVSLQETKWIIRNTLAESLDADQLAFLELVLYQKEDGLPLH